MTSRSSSAIQNFFLYGEGGEDLGLDTLHIEPLYLRSAQHDWVIAAHRHPSHVQLILFTKGSAVIRIEGDTLRPVANSVVLHPAGAVHEIEYSKGTEGLTITVALSYLKSLIELEPRLSKFFARPLAIDLGDDGGAVADLYQSILEGGRQKGVGWKLGVRGQFQTLLMLLLRRSGEAVPTIKVSRDQQIYTAFVEVVEANFRHIKKTSDYASQLAISPQRMNAACKAVSGQSASQILFDRLIVETQRMLAFTALPVSVIATELGFEDAAYFNRFFSKQMGIPPGEWRAMNSATEKVVQV